MNHGDDPRTGDPGLGPAHAGHETTDVSVRPLLIFLGALVVAVAVVMLVLKGQFLYYETVQSEGQVTPVSPSLMTLDSAPREPKIQERPKADMDELRAETTADLAELKWMDHAKGIAKIPIEDAMKLVVARGLPARKAPPAEDEPKAETKAAPPESENAGAEASSPDSPKEEP